MVNAVSGTRRAIKELVDGTIRVQVDIDPRFRKAFFDLFPDIDTPVALAPLVGDFDQPGKAPEPSEHAHRPLGPLAQLAVMWCRDPKFQLWCSLEYGPEHRSSPFTQEECRMAILDTCKIGSRKELDTVPSAGDIFHREFRLPFMEWMGRHG